MNKTRVPRTLSWVTIFSLLVSFSAGAVVRANSPAKPAGTPNVKTKISSDLLGRMRRSYNPAERVSVIIQLNAKPTGQLNALLRSKGVRVKREFSSFGSYSVELPLIT